MPAGSVSSFSTLQFFQEASHFWGLLCPPVYLLDRFPSLRHVQGSTPTEVFEGGCRPSTHASLDFPFHVLYFVASSLNLWGWWHVWFDCHLFRQSSGGHGWLLPPPLSSWRLRPYWAVQWSWFARVNVLCNLSCKKSREVVASLPGRFMSSRCFTLCITMEVEPIIAKQSKYHHCCSCKNYRGKGDGG